MGQHYKLHSCDFVVQSRGFNMKLWITQNSQIFNFVLQLSVIKYWLLQNWNFFDIKSQISQNCHFFCNIKLQLYVAKLQISYICNFMSVIMTFCCKIPNFAKSELSNFILQLFIIKLERFYVNFWTFSPKIITFCCKIWNF